MSFLDRINARHRGETRNSIDGWVSDYLFPASGMFGFGGNQYPYGLNTTYSRLAVQEISSTLPGHMAAVRGCPPAFAAEMVRALVLSQTRFTFRNPPSHPKTPRRTFGTGALSLLEHPWPNATTGELVARMEWHAGLAGNAFVTNRTAGRLRVLRPDWVAILYGSDQEPEMAAHALDGELLGYVYCPGGLVSTGLSLAPAGGGELYTLLPHEVAHWSPLPDPEGAGIGMSWITPAIREIQGDTIAAQHKVLFFQNAATPNLVVKGIPALTKDQFDEIVGAMEEQHAGIRNAYKTLYLTAGADATVVGANMQEVDFKSTVGSGETRISFLSRVPAPVLGISEGLAGSSLNAGNFGQARRNFSDTWVYPTLQDLCAALVSMVRVPSDAELWYDVTDMPLLREDAKDAAEIINIQVEGVTKAVREGFTAVSSIAAIAGQNVNLLVHTGLTSVQLQKPGEDPNDPSAGDTGPDGEPTDDKTQALSDALDEVSASRNVEERVKVPRKRLPSSRHRGGAWAMSMDPQLRHRTLQLIGLADRNAVPDDSDDLDEDAAALLWALQEIEDLDDEIEEAPSARNRALRLAGVERAWTAAQAAKHPRNLKGPGGGRFRSLSQRLIDWMSSMGNREDSPFDGFDRKQLAKVARARGLKVDRKDDRDAIIDKLVDNLEFKDPGKKESLKKAIAGKKSRALHKSVAVEKDQFGQEIAPKAVPKAVPKAKPGPDDVAISKALRSLSSGEFASIDGSQIDAFMAAMRGQDPPVNLSYLKVNGPGNGNLYDRHLRDIPRSEMPQLPTTVEDLQAFRLKLADMNVKTTYEQVDPRTLVATQSELNGPKVAKLFGFMREGGWQEGGALIISREGAVLDGHHRWAGAAAARAAGKDINVTALRVDMGIDELLDVAQTVSLPRKSLDEAPK